MLLTKRPTAQTMQSHETPVATGLMSTRHEGAIARLSKITIETRYCTGLGTDRQGQEIGLAGPLAARVARSLGNDEELGGGLRGHLVIYVICARRLSYSYSRIGGLVSLRSMRLLIAIWISAVLLSIVASYSLLNRR